MKFNTLMATLLAVVTSSLQLNAHMNRSVIGSGIPWYDNNGNIVNAHGACIVADNGKYYLFGEWKSDKSNAFPGFSCYSSDDLVNWKFERVALPVQKEGIMGPERVGERVKVMKCPATGKYMMYMHSDNMGYRDPYIAVAVADSINGEYRMLGPLMHNGKPVKRWDMGTFQDSDGKGYVLIHHGPILRLIDDYTAVDAEVANVAGSGESPAMFKKDGIYYMLYSSLTSWEKNDNFYFTAPAIEGPWTKRGFFCPEGKLTYNSQTTFVLPIVNGSDTTYLFMGDRWSYPRQASAATYVWQPLTVGGTKLSIPEYNQFWDIKTFQPYDVKTSSVAVPSTCFHMGGDWTNNKGRWISTAGGSRLIIPFRGERHAIIGESGPEGCYAKVSVLDDRQGTVYSSLVDFYSLYPEKSVRIITPELKKGNYTLVVENTADMPEWFDKKKGIRYGSKGTRLVIDEIRKFARKPSDTPIMGWSSWNTYRVNISDSLIRKQADVMVASGLSDAGYRYVNIDDGFFGYRDEKGLLHTHPTRFPNGLKPVAGYIHSLGLKAGIYSDAGSNTCGSIWDKDKNGKGVGLYGFEKEDAKLFFKDCGFDFIKIDYCGAGQALDLDERERYTAIRRAFDDVGCDSVSINICRWAFPGIWARDLARSWRISPDIRPKWSSVKDIIGKNMYLSAFAGDGHFNDMDMLEIGRGLSPNEEEVHFGMWCMMSSPLLIGCDLTKIPESSLSLIKNKDLIALNQDPLGKQAYVIKHEGAGYVLVKDIDEERGLTRAIAFYNPSDSVCRLSVSPSEIELGGKIHMRDLLQGREMPAWKKGDLSVDLSPRSVRIFKVTGESRLEPVCYEAEWAFLPCYDDLGKHRAPIAYIGNYVASGGVVVKNLGGRKENSAVWGDVFSEKGGEYELEIFFVPREDARLEILVNGSEPIIIDASETAPAGSMVKKSTHVTLNPGFNTVSMTSSLSWAPDLDCFTLRRN